MNFSLIGGECGAAVGYAAPATPRARIVRLDLGGASFDYAPGQAVLVAATGFPNRRPYSVAATPEDARRDGWLELLIGLNDDGFPGSHIILEPGAVPT